MQKYVILGIFYYGDNMLKKIIKLILIVFCLVLIFSYSADSGKVSTGKSDGLIIRVVETIMGRELNDSEKEKWIDYLVVPVRKGAHLFVYLVLGVLVISFLKEFMIVNYKVLLLAVFISFLLKGLKVPAINTKGNSSPFDLCILIILTPSPLPASEISASFSRIISI